VSVCGFKAFGTSASSSASVKYQTSDVPSDADDRPTYQVDNDPMLCEEQLGTGSSVSRESSSSSIREMGESDGPAEGSDSRELARRSAEPKRPASSPQRSNFAERRPPAGPARSSNELASIASTGAAADGSPHVGSEGGPPMAPSFPLQPPLHPPTRKPDSRYPRNFLHSRHGRGSRGGPGPPPPLPDGESDGPGLDPSLEQPSGEQDADMPASARVRRHHDRAERISFEDTGALDQHTSPMVRRPPREARPAPQDRTERISFEDAMLLDSGLVDDANEEDFEAEPERNTLIIEKEVVGRAEAEDMASVCRQRRDSIQSTTAQQSRGVSDARVRQRYVMLSDMVELVRSQMDPERRGNSEPSSMITELMTSLRLYTQELISCDRCSLFVKVKKGDKYVLWTMLESGQEISVPLQCGLVGASVVRRGPVRVSDASADPRFNAEVDRFTGYMTRSVLCVPVFSGKVEESVMPDEVHRQSFRSSCESVTSTSLERSGKHEDILGVLQVINKITKRVNPFGEEEEVMGSFDYDDEQVLRTLASMSSITIQVAKALESECRAKDRFAALGAMAKMLLRKSTADVRSLYRHIQSEAARLCQCERAFIYMLDAAKGHLQVESSTGSQMTLRLPSAWSTTQRSGSGSFGGRGQVVSPTSSKFVAGHCARSGATVNIADASTDDRWSDCLERRRLGLEELHAMIALPIEREATDGSQEIIGVLQAVNKKDSKGRSVEFDADDRELLEGLCVYIASALTTSMAFKATASSYKTVELAPQEVPPQRSPQRRGLNRLRTLGSTPAMVLSPDNNAGHISLDIISCSREVLDEFDLLNWSFNALDKTETELSAMIFPVFNSFNVAEDFRISDSTLNAFALEVSKGYFNNPFHCYAHGWSVLQACVHMLFMLGELAGDVLMKVDVLALFVAAISHDVGHPGTNNSYQQKICSPLALLYNDVSILENHHAAVCFQILCSTPEANVLGNLSKGDFVTARRMICNAILNTDMSRHERELARLRAHLSTPLVKGNDEDRQLTVCSLLHAADLSNPAREPDLAETWARMLAEEFQIQAQQEEEAGVEVSTFMLAGYRETNEIFFIQTFVKPLWDTMACALPPLKFYAGNVHSLLELLQKRVALEEAEKSNGERGSFEGRATEPVRTKPKMVPVRRSQRNDSWKKVTDDSLPEISDGRGSGSAMLPVQLDNPLDLAGSRPSTPGELGSGSCKDAMQAHRLSFTKAASSLLRNTSQAVNGVLPNTWKSADDNGDGGGDAKRLPKHKR